MWEKGRQIDQRGDTSIFFLETRSDFSRSDWHDRKMQITKEKIKEYSELKAKLPVLKQKVLDKLEKTVKTVGSYFDEPNAAVDIKNINERDFSASLYWYAKESRDEHKCFVSIIEGDDTSEFLVYVGHGYFPVELLFKTQKQFRDFMDEQLPGFNRKRLIASICKKLSDKEKLATGFYNA